MRSQEVQTRSEESGIKWWPTVAAAFREAERDATVWKVSWSLQDGSRVRLVRYQRTDGDAEEWRYEPLLDQVVQTLQPHVGQDSQPS